MTKILVDEMPVDPEDCPFVEFLFDNDKHRCKLGPRMKKCVLDLHEECDKLDVKMDVTELCEKGDLNL